jgi:hypothetical protein
LNKEASKPHSTGTNSFKIWFSWKVSMQQPSLQMQTFLPLVLDTRSGSKPKLKS